MLFIYIQQNFCLFVKGEEVEISVDGTATMTLEEAEMGSETDSEVVIKYIFKWGMGKSLWLHRCRHGHLFLLSTVMFMCDAMCHDVTD